MRSQAQIEASRRNGGLSRGPVTASGKQNSARNATRHGLYANSVCIPFEDRAKFEALFESYLAEYAPATATEMNLVQTMAAAKWREWRAISYESGLIEAAARRNREAVDQEFHAPGPVIHGALAFDDGSRTTGGLRLLDRYEARHTRAWSAARNELLKTQARREQKERTRQNAENRAIRSENEPGGEPGQ